jgi:hypothetical protein
MAQPPLAPAAASGAGAAARRGRERYGLLLAALSVAFAIQGVAQPGKAQQIITSALLGITLLLAFWAAEAKPVFMRLAAALVVGLVALSVVEALNGNIDHGATRVTNGLLVLLAPPAVVVGVVRNLRARQAVTLEAVFGVLCVYLLVGMLFAFVDGSIDRLGGAPFFASAQQASVSNCLYFSFVTLTTVGYGDFVARTNLGHTLSIAESLTGQIYLVTVVSLIVANLGRSRPTPRSS